MPHPPTPQPTPAPAPTFGEPDPAKFEEPAAYFKALARYEAQQTIRADREQAEQERNHQTRQERMASWKDRENKAMDAHPDYEDVADLGNLQANRAVSQSMASAIIASEHGPELLYHLGKNLDEARRIAALPTELAIMALGRIEASFAAPATTQHKVTSAPPPISPVTGASGGATVDPEKMSDADFLKHRQAQYRASRGH